MKDDFSGDYITWLRTFYQLAEYGSFSRAAAVVGKSQSTVTYQLKQLEKRLGVELINRRASPLELTHSGKRLFLHCQNLFNLLQQVNDEISHGEIICGDIVISSNYGLTAYHLPAKIKEFRRIYPKVNIEIRPEPISGLIKSYYSPEVDLLITQKDVLPEGAQCYELFSTEMALVYPKDWDIQFSDPVRVDDFIKYPFIAFWHDHPCDKSVHQIIKDEGYEIRIEQYASFFLPILTYVSLGSGISIMDEYQAKTPGFNVNIKSLKGLFPCREYVVAHKPKAYISPAVQKFLDFIQKGR